MDGIRSRNAQETDFEDPKLLSARNEMANAAYETGDCRSIARHFTIKAAPRRGSRGSGQWIAIRAAKALFEVQAELPIAAGKLVVGISS